MALSPQSPLVQQVRRIPDAVWAPVCEGALILLAGGTALASGHPWLFASLGPTAYEMVEEPKMPSARVYNVVVGHILAIGAGFTGVALTGAWNVPSVAAHSAVVPARLGAAVIAAALTALLTVAFKAKQPAALATALLVSLGAFQTAYSALWIACGVVIVVAIAEPLRRLRLAAKQAEEAEKKRPRQPRAA